MRSQLVSAIIFSLLFVAMACQHKNGHRQGVSKGIVEFKEKSFSFGELKHGDVVGHRFKFINSGIEPVMIMHVEKSCGCTDVIYSHQPVLPGDSGFVELVFDTKGWNGRQVKQVKVLTNDSIGTRELRIWADIQ